jgi:hypothetical protein
MQEAALALLQEQVSYTAGGVFRFFAGALLVLTIYGGAWLFTYWISKDE